MIAVVAAVLVFAAAEPFAHLSDKQMDEVMEMSAEREKEGKVDDTLERTMQNARSQLKRMNSVASREDAKEKDIDDEFDKVTAKAETTFERQKEDFEKKTESDMDKFEHKEEQVEEKFKDRSEKDMQKFEDALLPDGGESSFLQVRDNDVGDNGEFDYKYSIGQDKKKLVGIQEMIQGVAAKEMSLKKKVKDRTMKFDAKLDVMTDRANKKFDQDESTFESKLEEETETAEKKDEDSVDKFKAGMEKDADEFAEAMGVERPTVHHHRVMEDTMPMSLSQKASSFLQLGAAGDKTADPRDTAELRSSRIAALGAKMPTLPAGIKLPSGGNYPGSSEARIALMKQQARTRKVEEQAKDIEQKMQKTEMRAQEFEKREEARGEEELNTLRTAGQQHEAEWENKMNTDLARHEMAEQKELGGLQRKMQQKLEIFENAMLPDDYKPGGEKFQQENLEKDIDDKQEDIKDKVKGLKDDIKEAEDDDDDDASSFLEVATNLRG